MTFVAHSNPPRKISKFRRANNNNIKNTDRDKKEKTAIDESNTKNTDTDKNKKKPSDRSIIPKIQTGARIRTNLHGAYQKYRQGHK